MRIDNSRAEGLIPSTKNQSDRALVMDMDAETLAYNSGTTGCKCRRTRPSVGRM